MFLSAVEHIFQRDCDARKGANRASHSHSSRVRAKARVKRTRENPKESSKEPKMRSKVPKAHTMVKPRKLVYQVLKTRNQRQVQKLRNRDTSAPQTILGFVMAGVMMNGMTTGARLDGTKVGEQTYDNFTWKS